jgi:hypothetical protein
LEFDAKTIVILTSRQGALADELARISRAELLAVGADLAERLAIEQALTTRGW